MLKLLSLLDCSSSRTLQSVFSDSTGKNYVYIFLFSACLPNATKKQNNYTDNEIRNKKRNTTDFSTWVICLEPSWKDG